MSNDAGQSGFADVNGAKLYYELAGQGQPFVMIHAGVADSRQWNGEFEYFSKNYRVLRFDMRGYGKSEPVEGEFNIVNDFVGLLDELKITEPLILMGCSMGGGLAIDFALDYPERVKSLILVGSAPSGLELDAEEPALFAEVEKAYNNGDLDLVTELETQIWFDGQDRHADDVKPEMRKLAYEMNRLALEHESKKIGKHIRKEGKAINRIDELKMPILVIIGANDIPYLIEASAYMEKHMPTVRKVILTDAAHLPNMDQPEAFQQAIDSFLAK